jgi:organic hydroperoxide reductase OsmC/OhrA
MYHYTVSLKMGANENGILMIPQKPQLEVTTPPEFQGKPGIWSPEDLFVSSIESCLMTTLFYFLRRNKISPSGYESTATGILEKTASGLKFTSVTVDATLRISVNAGEGTNAEELANLVEKHCLISHSVSCQVSYRLQIEAP